MPIRRYLAIFLPRLATDRVIRKRRGMAWRQLQCQCLGQGQDLAGLPDEAPIIIVDQIRNAWRVSHLDEAAEQAGLCHGQSLSDARAICPHVDVVYENRGGDQLLLDAIADWCDRYTPLVSLDAPDGIMLDITGCAHLFGGEKPLADELLGRLFLQGFAASGAVASTQGAAWAASRFSNPVAITEKKTGKKIEKSIVKPSVNPDGELDRELNNELGIEFAIDGASIIKPDLEPEALAILPLAGLRLDGETLAGLAKLGLRTIGQVMARPRAPLTRRFGKLLILRLDQALGRVEEAICCRLPVPELMAERRLAEPIGRVEDVQILIERLALRLCADMEKRGVGARNINLALFRLDGKVLRLAVGTSRPLRDVANICRLFGERLSSLHDDFDAGSGFETGRLSALETEPYFVDQTSLLTTENNSSDFSHLVDRLGARLGPSRVVCMIPTETHLPEKVDTNVPVTNHKGPEQTAREEFLHLIRPLRLLNHPEPVEAIAAVPEGPPVRFRWRKKLHVVVHVEGPERISDQWWGDRLNANPHHRQHHTRDYFRIEDEEGYRYWLYRQGLYGTETNFPRWYMHGIFAMPIQLTINRVLKA